MADYRDDMNRNRSDADQSQPQSTEDTRGYSDEEFEDIDELDEADADEFESDERVTGEVGSEDSDSGDISEP